MNTHSNQLEQKVQQLERDLKRQKWTNMGLLMLGLVGACTLNAQTQAGKPDEVVFKDIVCRSLLIPGPDGKGQVFLKAGEDGGAVIVSNKAGKNVARLHAEKNGGVMQVRNNDSENVAVAISTADGGQFVVNNNDEGNIGFLGAAKQGKGEFALSKGDGKDAVIALCSEDGGLVIVNGKNGKNNARLAAKTKGGELHLLDSEGADKSKLP